MAGPIHRLHGHRVTRRHGLFQVLAPEHALGDPLGHHALPATGHLLADVGAHALLAGEGLQTAPLAAATEGAFRVQNHVTVLRRFELVAGVESAVQDQTASHAGADKEAHHVLVASGHAVFELSQHPQIHVVSDVEGDSEPLFHGALDVVVPPGQVGGEQHHARVLVDDAGGAGGNGVDVRFVDAGFFDHLLHHADDHFLHIPGGVPLALGALLQPVDDLPVLVENHAENLGSAHVQTDVIGFCHCDFLLYDLIVPEKSGILVCVQCRPRRALIPRMSPATLPFSPSAG